MIPDTLEPSAGDMKETVGAVVSPIKTCVVHCSGSDVMRLPVLSLATAITATWVGPGTVTGNVPLIPVRLPDTVTAGMFVKVLSDDPVSVPASNLSKQLAATALVQALRPLKL
jgi:hypothetical protein